MNLLGKGNDKEFFSNDVRNKECYRAYREWLLKDYETHCTGEGEFFSLRYSAYKIYAATGERQTFQNPYYRRRYQLGITSLLALIYPEEEKYMTFLMDKIFEVCNEYSWCIPAHQPNYLEKIRHDYIDLFAAETGFTLAQIYTLLKDRLDGFILRLIESEIDRRIINSFINSPDTYNWETKSTNNWAAVCMGSVGSTVMLMRPERYPEIEARADATMERYLSGFGDDGFCLEGTHYWHYGFGFFTAYAEILRRFTEGEKDYFKLPKVKAVATFIQKMYLSGKASVSFADCGRTLEYHLGMCHKMKSLYPDEVKVYSPELAYFDDFCGRYCLRLGAAIWLDEDTYNSPEPNDGDGEYYGENAQWLIKRNQNYGFAAKAGHNKEPHNHNDVGSFIYAKDGRQVLCDVGIGVYSKQYFNSQTRYTFIQCSSLGHSLPYFGDKRAQLAGAEFAASDVSYKDGVFSFDMAGAYGIPELKSARRTFVLSEDRIKLTDEFVFESDEPITERITTLQRPVSTEGGVIELENTKILYDEGAVEEININTEPLTRGDAKEYYLIDFKLRSGAKSFTATVI